MSSFGPILAEFLTLEALAAELRRNKRTLDRWDVLGIGPPRTRVGRRVLYRRASVERWLARQEHPVSTSTGSQPSVRAIREPKVPDFDNRTGVTRDTSRFSAARTQRGRKQNDHR